MKRLYLVRHAKSSWKNPDLQDFDRPLNKRGKRDAPLMGQRLKKAGARPDLIFCSPAKRAAKTAKALAREIGYPAEKIRWIDSLYAAGTQTLLEIVRSLDDSERHVMLVAHNPGLTYFAEYLTGISVENIPTSGVFAVDFETPSWRDIREAEGKLASFDYPKKR
jgi:phosphohistidine phosphatase